MFKELAAFAKRAPIILRIAPEGEGLRVMIHQKADELDDGEIPLALSVAGSAEQLDAELAGAIVAFTETTTSAESITEEARRQAKLASEQAVSKAEANKGYVAKKTEKKPAATPKKTKPAAQKKAAPPKPKKTTRAPPKRIASKPTKEQCIAAYHAYVAAHVAANPGEPTRREAFIKGNPTGRRFERLFGNWDKFIKAAMKTGSLSPADDKKTKPLPLTWPFPIPPAQIDADVPAGNETAAAQPIIPQPQPSRTKQVKTPAPAAAPATLPDAWPFPPNRGAVTEDGEVITIDGINYAVVEGQIITVGKHRLRVISFNDKTVIVEIVAAELPTGRTVVTTEGRPLAGGVVIVADTGMEIDIPGHGKHRIADFDDQQIVVEPITEGATA